MEKENVKTLLLLYQQHPCLYVVKSVDYHNRVKREKALKTICDQYTEITTQPITIEIAKKKINNLRSQYLDYVNKIKQSKASGASTDEIYKPTWWLYEDMKFLDPYISQRKGESSIASERFSKDESLTMNTILKKENESEDLQFLDVYEALEEKGCDKENIHQNIQLSPPVIRTSTCNAKSSSAGIKTSTRSTTQSSKRKQLETSASESKNDFWITASSAIKSISKNEETEDGLKHWILYLENELRKIKNSKKLKGLQKNIIALVDNANSD